MAKAMRSVGNCGSCSHAGGHPASIGRDSSGKFRTAPLKVYPSALCKVLAQGFVDHAVIMHRKRLAGSRELPPEQLAKDLAEFYQGSLSTHVDADLQRDYHGFS